MNPLMLWMPHRLMDSLCLADNSHMLYGMIGAVAGAGDPFKKIALCTGSCRILRCLSPFVPTQKCSKIWLNESWSKETTCRGVCTMSSHSTPSLIERSRQQLSPDARNTRTRRTVDLHCWRKVGARTPFLKKLCPVGNIKGYF
jgi:hypothetical protein